MSYRYRSQDLGRVASDSSWSRAPPIGCATRSSTVPASHSSLLSSFTPLDRHLDEVANLLQLTLEARRDRLYHDVLMVAETDRLERPAHAPRVPDAAADLLDAYVPGFGKVLLRCCFWPLTRVPYKCTCHN